MNIVICGGGNAAQTLIPLLASDPQHRVVVYAPMANEAERLAAAMPTSGLEAVFADGQHKAGKPHLVTADPKAAGPGAELILLALPSYAHEEILSALAPHMPATAWIGALPARGGFDWQVRALFPNHQGVVFGLQTLPWACRIQDWGRRVEVLGTKAEVDIATWTPPSANETTATVADIFGKMIDVPLQPINHFLTLTLANTGQIIHPGIMYGLFHDWNGKAFAKADAPEFYGGVDEFTATILQAMSDEIQGLCRTLEQAIPGLDLSRVAPVGEWLARAYPGQIADTSSLRSSFNTNRAYLGLKAPTSPQADGLVAPDFSSRYLTEDIPFSLLVSRGIAELVGMETPTITKVITWAQERNGRSYLVDGRVSGQDISHSRAPQRFGITELAPYLREQNL